MNKKYLYGLSALMLVSGMATMTSCQSEEDLIGGGQKVMLTISADKQDEATRTQFTPSGKGLNSVWTAGDQLLITTHSGIAGVVTLSSGAGTASGVFKGEVTLSDNGEDEIALFYLGKGVNPADVKDPKYTIDLSSQTDNLEGLAEKDFLATTCFVKNMNGTATASVAMNRLVDEAYFTLELPDGLTLGEGDVVTISGDNMTVGRAITLSKTSGDVWGWDNTAANQVTGSITVTKTSEMGNALYFTMHGNQTVAPTFTVTKDGYRYTATMSTAHTWNGSQFVNNNGEPIAVTDWTKEELPTDPGDFSNWGIPDGEPAFTDNGSRTPTADSGEVGWVYNQRQSLIKDCWFNPITFTKNGGVDGYLYSTQVAMPSYFQWGRWLGFPLEIGVAPVLTYNGNINDDYPAYMDSSLFPVCLDPEVSYSKFHYTISNMEAIYSRIHNTIWSNWTVEKSKNAASVWGMDASASSTSTLDYVVRGYRTNCNWTDRSGNPCPDGYRLPTKDELAFLTTTQTNFSSYAEIKTSTSGQKYAVRWEVVNIDVDPDYVSNVKFIANEYNISTNITSSNSIPALKITSFPVDNSITSISASDSRFNSQGSSIVIGAYGTLANNGCINFFGARGLIWGNESTEYASTYTGYAGVALEVRFSNGKVSKVALRAMDRAQGCNIIPVRDPKAKGSTLTPWWPYNMIGNE